MSIGLEWLAVVIAIGLAFGWLMHRWGVRNGRNVAMKSRVVSYWDGKEKVS